MNVSQMIECVEKASADALEKYSKSKKKNRKASCFFVSERRKVMSVHHSQARLQLAKAAKEKTLKSINDTVGNLLSAYENRIINEISENPKLINSENKEVKTRIISSKEFENIAFMVTAAYAFKRYLERSDTFLQIFAGNNYRLPDEDLKMIVYDNNYDLLSSYLDLCIEYKEIIYIDDEIFIRDNLINAIDVYLYKKQSGVYDEHRYDF